MPAPAEKPELEPHELRELSALADGSLDPARRVQVEARIASSPELTALYERERRVVELLHEARGSVRAPAGLRARIEAVRPKPAVLARRRAGYGGALVGALAAVVLAIVLALPGGSPGAPSVSQAAQLAFRGAAAAAPPVDASTPGKLATNVGALYFPNWQLRFGWRAVGQRSDHINGRQAVTVYYDWHGRRLAYTIVGAPVLTAPTGTVTVIHGVELRTLSVNNRVVVTWREGGHTCLLSGAGVSAAELQKLAAWEGSEA